MIPELLRCCQAVFASWSRSNTVPSSWDRVVVLGHQRCGAIEAPCEVVAKAYKTARLYRAQGRHDRARGQGCGKPGDFVDNAVQENARLGVRKIFDAQRARRASMQGT